MNNLVNKLYIKTYQRFLSVDLHEERGAEAVEWVAMVAVIIVLLVAVQGAFAGGGAGIGDAIVQAITTWAGKIAG